MQRVREAFMAKDAMAVIVGLVAEPLGRHPRMTEADGLVVQLVITFFRNLLTIPDRAATAGQTGRLGCCIPNNSLVRAWLLRHNTGIMLA